MLLSRTPKLREASLLRLMDGEKTFKHLGIICAGILVFNELNHCPYSGFTRVVCGEVLAAQTPAEAFTEVELLGCGQARVVEIIVAVGIEEAVGEDGGGELDGEIEKRLEAARRPGIAAGLNCVGYREGGIEGARPAGKLSSGREEMAGKQIERGVIEIKGGGSEKRECGDDALLGAEAARWFAGALYFALDGVKVLVIEFFAPALVS